MKQPCIFYAAQEHTVCCVNSFSARQAIWCRQCPSCRSECCRHLLNQKNVVTPPVTHVFDGCRVFVITILIIAHLIVMLRCSCKDQRARFFFYHHHFNSSFNIRDCTSLGYLKDPHKEEVLKRCNLDHVFKSVLSSRSCRVSST